jgi:hypothetical protein
MDVEDVEEGEHCDPGAGPKQDLSGEADSQALNEWVILHLDTVTICRNVTSI